MNTLGFRLLAERFQEQTGTQFTVVPYRAAGSVIADLVAGQIDLAVGTLTSHLTQVVLAVGASGLSRLCRSDEVPKLDVEPG